MTFSELLTRWFDLRPGEGRQVLVSFLGAYSVVSFLILARSLREAFYLAAFDVTTLPYVTIAVAILSLPAAALFGRVMAGGSPHRVFSSFVVLLGAMILGLAGVNAVAPRVANVAFYLITVLGASLLTSGFWMVTSEHYSLRQAKRLFGFIGAGGTLGAMITGVSLSVLTNFLSDLQLVGGLVILLASTLVLHGMMSGASATRRPTGDSETTGVREGIGLIVSRPHLRNIALIVVFATMASTILDYQFKEIVSSSLTTSDQLAGFFGAFYGWTGVISLFVQVFIAARLMSGAGIAVSLAVLPTLLLTGAAGMLVVPTLMMATLARGADNSLRKSLHRSVLEYLYVPVAPDVRRKTKTFIDSVVDSAAGGIGAAVLFVWVTWGGLPARYLSILVVALAAAFIYLSSRAGSHYARTVRDRLAAGGQGLEEELVASEFDARNLLTVTMTRLDLEAELAKAGVELSGSGPTESDGRPAQPESITERLNSPNLGLVARTLDETKEWEERHVPHLTRLLAQSRLYERAVVALATIGAASMRHLVDVLLDENADFVVRRRIPRILADIDTSEADTALLAALTAGRFEVRYRAAIALARRRKAGMKTAEGKWQPTVWKAIEREVSRDRPIWELQKILDGSEAGTDDFVGQRLDVRGELSLEHTFRLLSLVLDSEAVKMAFHGIVFEDEGLKSLSLEYLEHVLPPDIRERLWPFIGDISDYQRRQSLRSVDEVVSELSDTGATLFGGAGEQRALRDALESYGRKKK